MGSLVGKKENAISIVSLAPFYHWFIGRKINVELVNGNYVTGTVTTTDCFMNISMVNAVMISPHQGKLGSFPMFFIHKKFIRQVQMKRLWDLEKILEYEVDFLKGNRRRTYKKFLKKRSNRLKKKQL